jgi:hypothetical protein
MCNCRKNRQIIQPTPVSEPAPAPAPEPVPTTYNA